MCKIIYIKQKFFLHQKCFTLFGLSNVMWFSPHPSYSNKQSLGLPPPQTPTLSPAFSDGLLPLTSYCFSEWHATLPGIQFIWAMYNHKPYPLQPGRLTQRGPREAWEGGDGSSALRGSEPGKAKHVKISSCDSSKIWKATFFFWSTKSELMLLFCAVKRRKLAAGD